MSGAPNPSTARQYEALLEIPPEERTIGQQIKALRLRLGWSQQALADHMNVCRSAIGAIETGDDRYHASTRDAALMVLERAVERVAPPPLAAPSLIDDRATAYGRMLREARLAAGMTHEQVAQASGVPLGSIKRAERGTTRALTECYHAPLARALGIDPLRLARAAVDATDHVRFTLDADDSEAHRDLLAALAAAWPDLDEATCAALIDCLRGTP